VQQVGYSTLAVSLPKDWANDVGLHRGDVITFKREGDGLVIFPGVEQEEREVYISTIYADQCDEQELMTRLITGSYILGCDTIEVVSGTELKREHLDEIRTTTRRLTGIDIVEQTLKHVTIQSFVDPSRFPVEGLIRRLHIIASSMQLTAARALFEMEPELISEVLLMEEESDRIYYLIVRQLLLNVRGKERQRAPYIVGERVIAKSIEAIADCARNMAIEVIRIKDLDYSHHSGVLEELSQLNELVLTISDKTVEALFKSNVKIANDVIETVKLVNEKERIFSSEVVAKVDDVAIATAFRTISNSLRQIAIEAGEIAEITINRALPTPNDLVSLERTVETDG
jgi:phosphate uptake regulator